MCQFSNSVIAINAYFVSTLYIFQRGKSGRDRFQVCSERTEKGRREFDQRLIGDGYVFGKSAITFLAAHHISRLAESHGVGTDDIAYFPLTPILITLVETYNLSTKFMAYDDVFLCRNDPFGYTDIRTAYSSEMHFDKHIEMACQSRHFPVCLEDDAFWG